MRTCVIRILFVVSCAQVALLLLHNALMQDVIPDSLFYGAAIECCGAASIWQIASQLLVELGADDVVCG